MNDILTKDFPLEVKALTEVGQIEGYASVFGVKDSYGEIVVPTAFDETLARYEKEGRLPLMLWQHDPYEPIGVWDEMTTDKKGLHVKGTLLLGQSVPAADKTHSLLKAKAVRGMSIGYRIAKGGIEYDESKPEEGARLTKLDLYEVSIVSFPANKKATVTAVKSEEELAAIKFWKRFEDWARRVGDGEVPPPNEFEDILRDARVSKAQRTRIASRMHGILRSESGEEVEAATNAVAQRLRAAASAFSS